MIITAQQLETGHHRVPSGVVNPPVEFQFVSSLRRQEILEEMKRREDGVSSDPNDKRPVQVGIVKFIARNP